MAKRFKFCSLWWGILTPYLNHPHAQWSQTELIEFRKNIVSNIYQSFRPIALLLPPQRRPFLSIIAILTNYTVVEETRILITPPIRVQLNRHEYDSEILVSSTNLDHRSMGIPLSWPPYQAKSSKFGSLWWGIFTSYLTHL